MMGRNVSFLDFPFEIREQIYHLVLVPSRLYDRAILDPEWLFVADRGNTVAPLLFTSKQIYKEAAPIFYSKATLEIAPAQRMHLDTRSLNEFVQQHEDDYAFCPTSFLKEIRNIHVYSDQSFVVDEEAFQALFQWLVIKTGARHVYLSRKTMQQERHIPELIDLTNLAYDVFDQSQDIRVIDFCARNVSSRLRFQSSSGSNFNSPPKRLPVVQSYLNLPMMGHPHLYREPIWETRFAGDENVAVERTMLEQEMQRFASSDLENAYLRQAHIDGYLWLYKSIQIQRRSVSIRSC